MATHAAAAEEGCGYCSEGGDRHTLGAVREGSVAKPTPAGRRRRVCAHRSPCSHVHRRLNVQRDGERGGLLAPRVRRHAQGAAGEGRQGRRPAEVQASAHIGPRGKGPGDMVAVSRRRYEAWRCSVRIDRRGGAAAHQAARPRWALGAWQMLTSTIFTPSVFKMASSEARCRTAGGEGV